MDIRDLRTVSIVFAIAWIIVDLFGQISIWGSPILIDNQLCFHYLGCNAGFFGYDALVHFLAGATQVLLIIYLALRRRSLSLLARNWKWSFFLVLGLIVCLAFTWEFIEFSTDHIRIYILHQQLFNPNRLAQATSDDTVGDMFFATFGAFCALLIIRVWKKSWLVARD